MQITFPEKTIECTEVIKHILDSFSNIFKKFVEKNQNTPPQLQEPHLTETNLDTLRGFLSRAVKKSIIREFFMLKGTTLTLSSENFPVSFQSHRYFMAFISELHKHFIVSSKRKKCIQYDRDHPEIPAGEPLLLIQELLERIVARILCDDTNAYASALIDHVLQSFITHLARTDEKLKTGLHLLKDGTITSPGLFLISGHGHTIYQEIEALGSLIGSLQDSRAFSNATRLGLETVSADGLSLRRRLVVYLYYLDNPEHLKSKNPEFSPHLLNPANLTDALIELTTAVQKKFQLTAKNLTLVEGVASMSDCDLVINKIFNPWQSAFFDPKKLRSLPLIGNLLERIKDSLELEQSRLVLEEAFIALDELREFFGFFILLSGTVRLEGLLSIIRRYEEKATTFSKRVPEDLRKINAITTGSRGSIWNFSSKNWQKVTLNIQHAANPLVQERILRKAANSLQRLCAVQTKLYGLKLLETGEAIVDQQCLTRFCQSVLHAVVANPQLAPALARLNIFAERRRTLPQIAAPRTVNIIQEVLLPTQSHNLREANCFQLIQTVFAQPADTQLSFYLDDLNRRIERNRIAEEECVENFELFYLMKALSAIHDLPRLCSKAGEETLAQQLTACENFQTFLTFRDAWARFVREFLLIAITGSVVLAEEIEPHLAEGERYLTINTLDMSATDTANINHQAHQSFQRALQHNPTSLRGLWGICTAANRLNKTDPQTREHVSQLSLLAERPDFPEAYHEDLNTFREAFSLPALLTQPNLGF